MRIQIRLLFAVTLMVAGTFAVDSAYAGGCQRQRQPGDYLNCGVNGPYGPSGPNFIECRAQCTALKNCLNNPPPAGCATQTAALDACAPGIHVPGVSRIAPSLPTLAYKEGVGCFVAKTYSSAESFVMQEGRVTARASGNQTSEKCLLVTADMAMRDSGSTGFIGNVVARRLGVDRTAVTLHADLYADLGASYDDVRGIADELGYTFSVRVSEEAVKHMETVGDIVHCAESAMVQ